ncbi:unnamed protein product [marine sediment metagenome]|uniref:Uncharacterized protein n=1 Tax=marine sediment metagenome TaxID=412755 RepID=X0VEP7_9ZZZZ
MAEFAEDDSGIGTPNVDELVVGNPDNDPPTDGGSGAPSEGDMEMPEGSDKFHAIVESEMSQIAQSGRIAQNNFITTIKFADNDYLEGKRIVSLEEAIGVREVSSKSVPAGPNVP